MNYTGIVFAGFTFLLLLAADGTGDKGWQLKKDKLGIQVFTKQKADSRIYMYKVVADMPVVPQRVYQQVVDFAANLKHMTLVDSLRFLQHRKDTLYRNYMHFNMPWPVKNRDMVVEMVVSKDPEGIYLESTNLPDYLPPRPGVIRIEEFYEKWTIRKGAAPNQSRVTVTGWVDPGGAIPAWVVNLSSVKTPYQFIAGIRADLEQQP
ncbi:START domain-containing protein [Carboxylicivirga taeanensis]|uniref:START domain-containing protein n=1 Tax=Carboxylicivirga taeanensis TaxID=1416875 RepID=UPI003F6E421E